MLCLGFVVCIALLIGMFLNLDWENVHRADAVIFTGLWIIAMIAAGAGFAGTIP